MNAASPLPTLPARPSGRPVDRAARATALVGLGLLIAAQLGGSAPVAARVVRLEGVPRPGWYEADDLAAAAEEAGADVPRLTSAVIRDGDTVRLQDGWALPARTPAPLGVVAAADGGGPTPAFGGRVSLNRATQAELESLPGVGPRLAERIIAGRPYRNLRDLDQVRGIGERTLERLAPLVEP
jgi:competence protein ComEA